jgi:hypothetical protein
MISPFRRLQGLSLLDSMIILVAVVSLVWVAVMPVCWWLHGFAGFLAATVAAVACLAGAEAALVCSLCFAGSHHALSTLLVGMATRMGAPLICGIIVHIQGGLLAEAGLLYYLLVFYPVALATETVLSLPGCRPGNDPTTRRDAASSGP